ncbi:MULTISPECIES: HNH endonuclease signature motif containing protein [Nostocales]|uniref:HNH endonuclease n=2 Tax=Aphanizomenonaceae TaxID=1892259 RepID=A0ACC7S0E8_DOLFA|nr:MULTISPECIES: HNH endonuclease signature motif containing protein [Nostocales]MBD2277744.1 HNH endonuclease [Aphanizomenon flos-aquae FACHB-1040]MBO1071209.1 HNH endonuclease [Dolichospermum sp. DEX189]MCX5981950.1 HNH endonuclease signature motif containing protein [Nostocales cyanobacterium LacPavin_0920_SED1_MAG_38_18]ALB40513.1 HNH endonuclease [Anabaena sp. WA102]MBO1063976.1 HNH endonuclease [Anabaena sp. 54]
MSTYISESLRQKIIERDKSRCCYCLTSEANSGIPMTYDHIHPVSKGGETTFENLCLACRSCNEFKSDAVESIDPLSGETIQLFNPRQQKWTDHFGWSADGTRLEGINAIGRTTIVKLRINNPVILIARKRWVISGWHPPLD